MTSSEIFEGRSSEMKPDSPWLASEDILDVGDVEVTIKACHRHKDVAFDKGRKSPVVYSVEFEGKRKQLVLNSTNRQKIVEHYGGNVKEWSGKTIVLYVDHEVQLKGKKVNGIRIR